MSLFFCTLYEGLVHPIFCVWSLLATKLQKYELLRNLCLHFERQDGQDGKKPGKKIMHLK